MGMGSTFVDWANTRKPQAEVKYVMRASGPNSGSKGARCTIGASWTPALCSARASLLAFAPPRGRGRFLVCLAGGAKTGSPSGGRDAAESSEAEGGTDTAAYVRFCGGSAEVAQAAALVVHPSAPVSTEAVALAETSA